MNKIVIIGANNFQVPLIKKAGEMGLETFVFAWEEGAVGRDYCDHFYPISIMEKEKILSIAREINPVAVVSIGSDLASITVNYLAEELGLPGNSMRCSELTTNKFLMRERLSERGINCPGFVRHTSGTGSTDANHLRYPLIIKPVDRSGSRGVTKIKTMFEMPDAVARALTESFCGECVIEEFITGKEFSVEMISYRGKHHFLQITEKETTGAPFFVEKGQHQPASLSEAVKNKIIDTVTSALNALEVTNGASHTEVLVTKENEVYIVETGARMGGDYIGSHLVRLSTGYDFLKGTIQVAMGEFEEPILDKPAFSGIYYEIPKPGIITEVIDNTNLYTEIVQTEVYYKVGYHLPEVKESNQRAASFIYQSISKKFEYDPSILQIITEQR